jgi:hypothetical protein
MRRTLFAVVVIVLLPAQLRAQTRPNFSGHWSMDPSRSESAMQNDPVGSMTVTITQTLIEMQMDISRDGKTGRVTYRLDGSPSVVPNGTATSHWDGGALMTETLLTIQGQTVTTKETRRLNDAEDEMTVETILEVQHGYSLSGTKNYGAGKDVFVRTR